MSETGDKEISQEATARVLCDISILTECGHGDRGRKEGCEKHFKGRVDRAPRAVGYEGHDDVLSLK